MHPSPLWCFAKVYIWTLSKVTKQYLEKVHTVLPSQAFPDGEPKTGPQIFLTNNNYGQEEAFLQLQEKCPLLLCTIHFLKAIWR